MTWDGFKGAVRLSVCEAPRHDSRTVLSFMMSRRQSTCKGLDATERMINLMGGRRICQAPHCDWFMQDHGGCLKQLVRATVRKRQTWTAVDS
jgi:hypothetical protein